MMKQKVIDLVKKSHEEGDFKYHILAVVNNALLLAKKLNADLEIVEIAAYLHDIGRAGSWDDYEIENEHHILGEKKVRKILSDLDCDKEFIEKVAHCVLAHRGRKDPEPETVEAQIVNCADAMAHFDTFLDLFIIFIKTGNSFEKAVVEIEKKMERNWNKKLSLPEAKEIVKDKYEAIMLLLKSMKDYF